MYKYLLLKRHHQVGKLLHIQHCNISVVYFYIDSDNIRVFFFFFLDNELNFLSIADIYRFIILVSPHITRPSSTIAYLRQINTFRLPSQKQGRFTESQKGERRKKK